MNKIAHGPLLTLAIPHYRHPQHLEVVLESVFAQDFDDFEILVSDDHSPEGPTDLQRRLDLSPHPARYFYQPSNLGYDGNVRFCLREARGRFTFLLGNDDALYDESTLSDVAVELDRLRWPSISFTNTSDWADPSVVDRRAIRTCSLGAGPSAALRHFRSFSFVSGLVLDSAAARSNETDRWDGSIYYQIYVACRIISAGGSLAGIDLVTVRKDVRVGGETVETYEQRASTAGWSLRRRHVGLDSVARVTLDAVSPFLSEKDLRMAIRSIMTQLFSLTYPYWLMRYRAISNWSLAFGVAREMWPARQLAAFDLGLRDRARLWNLYMVSTLAGLVFPQKLLDRLEGRVRNWTRRRRQT